MPNKVRFLGLDVHAETIAVVIAEADGEVRSLGMIANRVESIRKLIKKLGPIEQLRACYEAGQLSPRRRYDGGLGSRCSRGGATRSDASP